MGEAIKLNSIDQYDQMYDLETLHPLVTVVDLSKATLFPIRFTLNYGLYALFLKQTKCGGLRYGRQVYGYQEGTVTSFASGQVVEVKVADGTRPKSHDILFHPDLIRGTSLGQEVEQCSLFSYASNEALRPSDEGKKIFQDYLDKVQLELSRPISRHSKRLISRNIELLSDYYMRFYEWQFVTRSKVNKDVLVKFEELSGLYFQNEQSQAEGLPTVRYFTDKIDLSSSCFSDLVKKETDRTAQEYIQGKIINAAKEKMLASEKTVSEIAYEPGFRYPQHFTRILKKNTGCTPTEYGIIQVWWPLLVKKY